MLDACKQSINKALWPYIAPTTKNEWNQPVPVCECICHGELSDAYMHILKEMALMAPGRKSTEVYAVFSDEFLNPSILTNAGYTNAKLFYDHYHLRQKFEENFSPFTDTVSHMTFC